MLTNDSDLEPEWALTSMSCCTICFSAYMEVVVVPRVSELQYVGSTYRVA